MGHRGGWDGCEWDTESKKEAVADADAQPRLIDRGLFGADLDDLDASDFSSKHE